MLGARSCLRPTTNINNIIIILLYYYYYYLYFTNMWVPNCSKTRKVFQESLQNNTKCLKQKLLAQELLA